MSEKKGNGFLAEIKEFYEKQRILTVIIMILIVGILIPVIVTWIFNITVNSNNSSNGNWLSFWGGILGGILGGLATLIGVKLSIKQMKDENELKYKQEKVVIMPMAGTFEINKRKISPKSKRMPYRIESFVPSNEKDKYDISNDEEYEELNEKLYPKIKLVNVSNKNAIDVNVLWNKPNKADLKIGGLSIDGSIYDNLEEIDDNTRYYHIPLIRNSQSNGEEYIYLYKQIQSLIFKIIDLINEGYEKLEDINLWDIDINLGTMIIKSKDMLGEST